MSAASEAMLAEVRRDKAAFLLAFEKTGNVTVACRQVGIGRRQRVYEWIEEDPNFREAYKEANEIATDLLVEEVRRRGYEGWDEPVYHRGEQVGVVRKYDSTLLARLLEARDPANWGRKVDVRASVGGPTEDLLTPEERARIRAAYLGLPMPGTEGDGDEEGQVVQAEVRELGDGDEGEDEGDT